MTGLDLFLMAVLGLGVVRGFLTGGSRQLVSTAGWLVGFVLGAALMEPVGQAVAVSLGVSERTAPVVGFVVVFTLALGAVAAVGHAFRKALEAVKLGGIDQLLGAALGGLKAALGLSAMLLVTGFSPLPGGSPWAIAAESREASILYEPVRDIGPQVWGLVRAATPGIQDALSEKFRTWDEERAKRDDATGGAGEAGPK